MSFFGGDEVLGETGRECRGAGVVIHAHTIAPTHDSASRGVIVTPQDDFYLGGGAIAGHEALGALVD